MVDRIDERRQLTEKEIEQINRLKDLEAKLDQMMAVMRMSNCNQRNVSIAATHMETAFMHAVKAITRPKSA